MKKLLADYFPNNKERQDFFIALAVIALFIIGILSYILPDRTALPTTPLTAEELTEKVADLESQRLAFDKHVVTDIEGYHPYYDHQQAAVIHDDNQLETTEVATAAAMMPTVKEEETIEEIDTPESSSEELKSGEETAENETSIIIESDEVATNEEELEKAILEEVPPNLNEDGSIIESDIEAITSDETESEVAVETYDTEADAAAIEAERERERLAAEAKAKAERARQAQLAKERAAQQAARKKQQAANTLKGCHVIVGAFKNMKNARSFREQVKQEKFKVAVGSVRGKTYVGIPVKCNNQAEIKAIQERVNATFGIKSWTLRN